LFSIGIIFLFSSVGFAWQHSSDCVEGNGKTKEVQRSLESFNEVAVHGAYTISLVAGTKTKCIVRGDSNLLQHVKTEVHNNKLQIENDTSLCMKQPLEVELQVPNLKSFWAEGVNEVTIKNLHEKSFTLILDGANMVVADGAIVQLKVKIAGTSTLDARRLVAKHVDVTAAGTTSAMVQVQQDLNVTASGIAEVLYTGKPDSISSNLSGLAEISPLN